MLADEEAAQQAAEEEKAKQAAAGKTKLTELSTADPA